jgi:hypothetical protein
MSDRQPGTFVTGYDPRRGRGPKRGAENAGRPPSAIRASMRASLDRRLQLLEEIADGALPIGRKCPKCGYKPKKEDGESVGVDTGDRLRALEMLAKYGLELDKGVSATDVRQRLIRTIEVIHEALEPQQALAVIDAMRPIWA